MSLEEEIVCYSEIISRNFSAGTEGSLTQDNRFTDIRIERETSVSLQQRYACLIVRVFFFVRLSPLCTSATVWPTVTALDGRWWVWSSRWNENWQGKLKYSEKTCCNATLFPANPTWPNMCSNTGRRGGKPATNRLSYGTASIVSSYDVNEISGNGLLQAIFGRILRIFVQGTV
jgi:hypothetical protein